MRPWRQVFAVGCSLFLVFCIIYNSHSPSPPQHPHYEVQPTSRLGAFFSFRTPSSFFPANALISLTYENSTFFSARPATFGPSLPTKGLSGQLWLGNGFGDEALSRRGIAIGSEGELGCSDVPGLPDMQWSSNVKFYHAESGDGMSTDPPPHEKRHIDTSSYRSSEEFLNNAQVTTEHLGSLGKSDGTDDHLHKSRSPILVSGLNYISKAKNKLPEHADIQSLQESAEITGKIVLLSRGGCGFFEKVKWAQRRGAIAVIVADNIPGRGLVSMNARGDTSNISIPSLFTHHTTAHVLASLIPPGFDSVTPSLAKGGRDKSFQHSKSSYSNMDVERAQKADSVDQRTFTQATTTAMHTPTSYAVAHKSKAGSQDGIGGPSTAMQDRTGWWRSFWYVITFGYGASKDAAGSTNSRRPPSSGNIDWFMVEDWDSDEPKIPTSKTATGTQGSHDDFVIGVQDWRDPDVVALDSAAVASGIENSRQTTAGSTSTEKSSAITPGSGEYAKPSVKPDDALSGLRLPHQAYDPEIASTQGKDGETSGWLSSLRWSGNGADGFEVTGSSDLSLKSQVKDKSDPQRPELPPFDGHEGLWVTLTPSSMSTSPFFDTLIVLVISPLITLTVVYTMLLVRSRIRRRRWRAPKSVVDQLPVRTYHIHSTRSSSPGPAISTSTPCTSTTPLLAGARVPESRSRPRSRTTSGAPETLAVPNGYGSLESTLAEQEKLDAGLAEWRRRYGGKQVECIVCLEEYIDGVSKVMSLPCGHEFHADCITPWLTTRRRTCPICKGDVVRSLGKSPMKPTHISHLDEDSEEDIQVQAAETVNESPSAAMPITSSTFDASDLERGDPQASQSLPTLRISRGIRSGLHALRLHKGGRSQAQRPQSPTDEGRDR